MEIIINGLTNFNSWGWKWIYSLFFPVYWIQDCNMKNKGKDTHNGKGSYHNDRRNAN